MAKTMTEQGRGWQDERARLLAATDKTQAELARVRQERDALEAAGADQRRWMEERTRLTNELRLAQGELGQVRAELEQSRKAQAAVSGGEKAWQAERTRLAEDVAAAQKLAAERLAALDKVQAAQKTLEQELAALRKAPGAEALARVQAELDKVRAELASASRDRDTAKEQAASRTSMHEALLQNHEALRGRLAEVNRESMTKDAAIASARQEAEAARAELESMRKGETKAVRDLRDQLAAAQADLEKSRKRADALTLAVDERAAEIERLRRELKGAARKPLPPSGN